MYIGSLIGSVELVKGITTQFCERQKAKEDVAKQQDQAEAFLEVK